MPVHYVERENLADKIRRLEEAGEQIASVIAEGDNFQVFTVSAAAVRKAGGVEKRPA